MKRVLLIGAVIVALFVGAQMLTEKETVGKNISMSSESARREAGQKTNEQKNFFSLVATAKELTPAQKKLEELGFYSDKFQSIQIKRK